MRGTGKKRLFLVELESLNKLKRELDQLLDTEETCHRLEVGHHRLMTLVRSGRLRPERGPSVDGFAEWKFTVKVVDECRATLSAYAVEGNRPFLQLSLHGMAEPCECA